MSVHPKNTSLGEVRLAGGSHACDRRESQFGMVLMQMRSSEFGVRNGENCFGENGNAPH